MNGDPDRQRNPLDALGDAAWLAHEEHDRLEELKAERGLAGEPTWLTSWEDDEDDPQWCALMFRPVDPQDGTPIRIGRWPASYVASELEAWRPRSRV
jgi:hypothetical protein